MNLRQKIYDKFAIVLPTAVVIFALASAAAAQGRIAFESTRDGNWEIYAMNPDGSNQTRLTNDPASDSRPALSPDGSKIAFVSQRTGNAEIFIMNANGSNLINLTNHPMGDYDPKFSPDGSKIAFRSGRSGTNLDIYVMNIDGSNQVNVSNHPS